MGLLKFFSGKDPEEHEKEGDAYIDIEEFGPAKLEYENAFHKLEKKRPDDTEYANRLQVKIVRTTESLARSHMESGEELLAMELYDDAEDIFLLASELTENRTLKDALEDLLQETKRRKREGMPEEASVVTGGEGADEKPASHHEGDEYFTALVSTLPDEIRHAYLGYGDTFKEGYVALNQGDYEGALVLLTTALEENMPGGDHIFFEIGTACLNLGKPAEARKVLEEYVRAFPLLLRGYHLLCEALWEMEAFEAAHEVIRSSPPELRKTPHMKLLDGETLFRAGHYEKAESFYNNCLNTDGWDENIVRHLALTCEALGKTAKANDLYGEIMSECQQCRTRLDPFIKARYADTAFELGNMSGAILELYLSLAQEVPGERARYYRKISRIYSAQGHEDESLRYLAFAERIEEEEGSV
ncbi:MAG: tetratricopeptide repeat protein [Deltaproteobacteria bacterium]|nr:tetratricopeptide repeat protein [Deltaproteobacteria bacterium]